VLEKLVLYLDILTIFFTDNHLKNLDLQFKMKIVKVKNETIKLLIWDIPSEKLYDTSSKNLYKGSRGIIFIYDVTDQNSFKNNVNLINKVESNMNFVYTKVLVGNKCDKSERVVTEEEGKKLAEENNMNYFETSAKTDQNIIEVFKYLSDEMYNIALSGDRYKRINPQTEPNKKEKKNCFHQ